MKLTDEQEAIALYERLQDEATTLEAEFKKLGKSATRPQPTVPGDCIHGAELLEVYNARLRVQISMARPVGSLSTLTAPASKAAAASKVALQTPAKPAAPPAPKSRLTRAIEAEIARLEKCMAQAQGVTKACYELKLDQAKRDLAAATKA